MKKTYVLQFDYDEEKEKLTDTFGVTKEQVEDVYKRYAASAGQTKSASLVDILDSGDDIPGGAIAVILANAMSGQKRRSSSMSSLAMMAAIGSMIGHEGSGDGIGSILAEMEGSAHDCASCAGYDLCQLPFKKPKNKSQDGEPS